MMNRKLVSVVKYSSLLLASLLFVLVFSVSTSPIYHNYWGGDSAIFQLIGKYWAIGGDTLCRFI